MNRGAWYPTEKIIECYRDIDELLVLGGVIWGNNPDDDYFLASHGVATPDAFWKLIVRGKDRVIAWVIPNSQEATQARLDAYLVSVQELEARLGETFPEPGQTIRSGRNPKYPGSCSGGATRGKARKRGVLASRPRRRARH